MKSDRISKLKIIIPIAVLVVLVSSGALAYSLITRSASADKTTSTASFSFDVAKSPGWWSPGNYSTTEEDANNYKGDAGLPVSSLNAFQGEKGDQSDQCFVTASNQIGSIDVEATLKKKTMPLDSSSSYKFLGTKQHTMQTSEGAKEYSVYQYDLVTPTPSQYGNEFAFIPLSKGYIQVTGICPTADMLASNEAALDAISLKL